MDSPTKTHKLRDSQIAFIDAYTDQNSKTYLNATQSYIETHPNATYETAKTQGSISLSNPHIRQSIDEILHEANAGYKVRLKHLVDLSLGRIQIHTVTTNADGSETVVKRDVPPSDRLKALKLLSDLTGETEQARVQAELMTESQRRLAKEMFARARQERAVGPGDGARGGKAGARLSLHSPSEIPTTKKVEAPEAKEDE